MSITSKKKEYLAMGGLLTAAFIWGFGFIIVKNSVDFIPSIYILAFRFTIAAIGLSIIFHKKFKLMNKTLILNGIILGSLLVFSSYVQTIGAYYTTAGKSAFLTTVYVVMVPFLQWIMYKKRPDIYCITAGILALFGIGLLSLNGNMAVNYGDVLTLLSGFGYALHMIYLAKYTTEGEPVLLTLLQMIAAGVLSWGLAFVTGTPLPKAALEPSMITGMLYLGLLSTMVAFLLQSVGQKYTKPSTAALFLSLESVFGVIFSSIFLKEILTSKMLTGCVVIFIAVILSETKFDFLRKKEMAGDSLKKEELGETVS